MAWAAAPRPRSASLALPTTSSGRRAPRPSPPPSGRGAFPQIENLQLQGNPIGSQGVAALAAPLRKMPALSQLFLSYCEIGDEGVASLVDNLGKDDFKALQLLWQNHNKITDAGVAKLLAALDAGGLPKLVNQAYLLEDNPASAVAVEAVHEALVQRGAPKHG